MTIGAMASGVMPNLKTGSVGSILVIWAQHRNSYGGGPTLFNAQRMVFCSMP